MIDGVTMLGVASKDVLLQMLLYPTSLDDVIKPSAKSPFHLLWPTSTKTVPVKMLDVISAK